jgi:hypothetical protein
MPNVTISMPRYRVRHVAPTGPDGTPSDLDRRLIIEERGWHGGRTVTITWSRLAPLSGVLAQLGAFPDAGQECEVSYETGSRIALIALATKDVWDQSTCVLMAEAIARAMPQDEVSYWLAKCRTSCKAPLALQFLIGNGYEEI